MSPLKARNGRLLSRNGHLCKTCCSPCPPCTGECIDFSVLFPHVRTPPFYPAPPGSFPTGEYCFNPILNQQIAVLVIYEKTVQNTSDVTADLVVSGGPLYIDDVLKVNGVLLADEICSWPTNFPCNTVLASSIPAGGSVTLQLLDTFGIEAQGIGCACWRPAVVGSSSPSVKQTPSSNISKVRFEVCKTCSDSLQDGFACRLITGCCWGRRRADPTTTCPKNQWPL